MGENRMVKRPDTEAQRQRRHRRVRGKIGGSAERPRLNVFRSLNHIYAQVIDDTAGKTLCSASSLDKEFNGQPGGNRTAARAVGKLLAERAVKAGITEVVFDRGGYLYHGRVQELADYAASLGISTTLENHGLYVNGADRLIRILMAAGRPNVGLTVDVGNYLCVDDDYEAAVGKSIGYADMIHLKDFYIRRQESMLPQKGMYITNSKGVPDDPVTAAEWRLTPPQLGYIGTVSGNHILRGAILGQGDMDIWRVLRTIKQAGYDKEISIEFEGMEECETATSLCLDTARYIWDRV